MAVENISPWLGQIRRTRPIIALDENAHTTIAIVGGGISGVATAYFLLRDTDKSVTLLERDLVAHGATGHNGGQAVAAFETPLAEISKNFGYDLVSKGLRAVNSAWDLLHSMLEDMLLTRDRRYDCALVGKSGLINSALFCEELVSKMIERYPSRFRVYENTPVRKIEIGKGALLRTPEHELKAQQVVLCTNGYTDLKIEGVSRSLRCIIESVLGYMAGYLDKRDLQPTATVYFAPGPSGRPGGYFYLSRRKYAKDADGSSRTLMSVGGPSQSVRKGENHGHGEVQDEHEYAKIDDFYRKTIFDVPGDGRRDFSWNGLMGYTPDGIRLIGPDPANSSLMYNLGCNGIGILPSIYGGKRIAQYINGEELEPSIFDPRSG